MKSVSILGLLDGGLKEQEQKNGVSASPVSILGLLDGGLKGDHQEEHHGREHVSILGLLDGGLKYLRYNLRTSGHQRFNPWFVGWGSKAHSWLVERVAKFGFNPWFVGWGSKVEMGLLWSCVTGVSILGLLDGGLKIVCINRFGLITGSFNPWFVGWGSKG